MLRRDRALAHLVWRALHAKQVIVHAQTAMVLYVTVTASATTSQARVSVFCHQMGLCSAARRAKHPSVVQSISAKNATTHMVFAHHQIKQHLHVSALADTAGMAVASSRRALKAAVVTARALKRWLHRFAFVRAVVVLQAAVVPSRLSVQVRMVRVVNMGLAMIQHSRVCVRLGLKEWRAML
jgi:hypothetical protein